MEATPHIRRIAALVLTIVLALPVLLSGTVGATHWGSSYPDCVNQVPAASAGSYELGRIRGGGYAGGTIAGVDLRLVDQVSPGPNVFVQDSPGGPTQMQVAGALLSLNYPGLQNTFLNGGAPVTEVQESAYPLDTTRKAHAGAQTLSVIFNGQLTVHEPESFKCESVQQPFTLITYTIQKVALDGYATAITDADDGAQEPWGEGLNIQVNPGDTSNG